MTQKVFGIGFQKTGTSTLGEALSILGYNVCGVRGELAHALENGNLKPVWELTEHYDAFEDNPWPLLYKTLDEAYPGSKFILTVRDPDKWIGSVVNHFGQRYTTMRKWIYGIGHPKGNEELYLRTYMKHNDEVREYFKDRPNDLLEISWEEGDRWKALCNFLECPLPKKKFPHNNKGRYFSLKNILKSLPR